MGSVLIPGPQPEAQEWIPDKACPPSLLEKAVQEVWIIKAPCFTEHGKGSLCREFPLDLAFSLQPSNPHGVKGIIYKFLPSL